jgi:hypothetical protein
MTYEDGVNHYLLLKDVTPSGSIGAFSTGESYSRDICGSQLSNTCYNIGCTCNKKFIMQVLF